MRSDLTIRKTKTSSGATAVQVVRFEENTCRVVKHIGSAHDEQALAVLFATARQYVEDNCKQPSLFSSPEPVSLLQVSHATLVRVTHQFARNFLCRCAQLCGLKNIPDLFIDFALMRIIEPTSKLRTIELLQRYFDIHYAQRTVYRALPRLLNYQKVIETAAITTATKDLAESIVLVLYDVTTLYFESFKEYDFQQPGFSKDNKPQQPQIVIGLLTTRSGFPLMHEVFEGNSFEGHTMLGVVHRFQTRFGAAKPVIVADAAMLSQDNMTQLENDGYHYIVGARLANLSPKFIEQIHQALPPVDKAVVRFSFSIGTQEGSATVCEFSQARFKKDKREFEKQIKRAQILIEKKEPGKRAKFVKKSISDADVFVFNDALRIKTEKLLGIKGFVTNIPETDMTNAEVIACYHDLWHIEQSFRMSKSDLKARPIFHHTQDAIRAHLLLCFMALMMGKYLELKTGSSLRKIRDELWQVQEAHVKNDITNEIHILRTELSPKLQTLLPKIFDLPH
jgi:transposase